MHQLKKIASWLKERICHKIKLLSPSRVRDVLKKHGLVIAVIFVCWEAFEDFVLPILLTWMGAHVHPFFYVLAPVAVFMCLHPIMVPVIFGAYLKVTGKAPQKEADGEDNV